MTLTENSHNNQQFSKLNAVTYDIIYQNKPYTEEATMVLNLFHKAHGRMPETYIDLACGTGKHLVEFAKKEIFVHGNDLSQEMLDCAAIRLKQLGTERYFLNQSPMQSCKVSPKNAGANRFDLATAFYTTVGYLTDPQDLDLFFKNLRTNVLKPGGCLFADLWSGHKMATGFSPYREKHVENEHWTVRRISKVKHLASQNTLHVHYDFEIQSKHTAEITKFSEDHHVRYHTEAEIVSLCQAYGLKILDMGPFFDEANQIHDAWNFYLFAQLV